MEDSTRDEAERYVIVPSEALSPTALDGLIEEYVTREGTDYGERVYTLEEKKRHVLRQLRSGEVVIVFELEHESSTLRRRDELNARRAG